MRATVFICFHRSLSFSLLASLAFVLATIFFVCGDNWPLVLCPPVVPRWYALPRPAPRPPAFPPRPVPRPLPPLAITGYHYVGFYHAGLTILLRCRRLRVLSLALPGTGRMLSGWAPRASVRHTYFMCLFTGVAH